LQDGLPDVAPQMASEGEQEIALEKSMHAVAKKTTDGAQANTKNVEAESNVEVESVAAQKAKRSATEAVESAATTANEKAEESIAATAKIAESAALEQTTNTTAEKSSETGALSASQGITNRTTDNADNLTSDVVVEQSTSAGAQSSTQGAEDVAAKLVATAATAKTASMLAAESESDESVRSVIHDADAMSRQSAPDSNIDVIPDVEDASTDGAAVIASANTASETANSASDNADAVSAVATTDSSSKPVSGESLDIAIDDLASVAPEDSPAVARSNSIVGSVAELPVAQESMSIDAKLDEASALPEPVDEVQPSGGAIFGFFAGFCTLLLSLLTVSAFYPEVLQSLYAEIPADSLRYRLIMVWVLLILTTSFFLMVSGLIAGRKRVNAPIQIPDANKGFFNRLFDVSASSRRVIAGALGPVLLGLGQGMAISAGHGAFGFSVLLDGINKTFLVPFWISQTIITVSCLILAWLWARVPLGLGTLTALLLIGPAISFGADVIPEGLTFGANISVFVAGLFLFAFGIALAAAAALGPDGFTALSLAAERVNRWAIPLATLLWDITAIAAGMILGGSVGIATAVGLLGVPFLLYLFIPPLRRVLQ